MLFVAVIPAFRIVGLCPSIDCGNVSLGVTGYFLRTGSTFVTVHTNVALCVDRYEAPQRSNAY